MKDFPDQTGPMYAWKRVEKVQNAEECLQRMAQQCDCYLVTNANDSTKVEINKALQRVHLDKYFKDIFCFKEIGFKKPSKEYFEVILKKISLKPHEAILVGDNLDNDVVGALQNGMEAVLFDPEEKNQYKGLKVRSLLDIETVIQTITHSPSRSFIEDTPA